MALNLCTRLQLCSTAQSSRSDSSLAGSSTRSVPAVPRQPPELAGRSSHPDGGHRLRYHVCLRTGVLKCLDDASLHLDFTFVSLVSGHPRPPVLTPPVYRACPCGDPLRCHRCPGKMASGAERQPLWLRCVGGGRHVMWTFLIHALYKHSVTSRAPSLGVLHHDILCEATATRRRWHAAECDLRRPGSYRAIWVAQNMADKERLKLVCVMRSR